MQEMQSNRTAHAVRALARRARRLIRGGLRRGLVNRRLEFRRRRFAAILVRHAMSWLRIDRAFDFIFKVLHPLLKLDHALAERAGHGRQAITKENHRDYAYDQHFRRTNSKHDSSNSCCPHRMIALARSGHQSSGQLNSITYVPPCRWPYHHRVLSSLA